VLSLPFQMEFPLIGSEGIYGIRRQVSPALVLSGTKGEGKRIDFMSRVQGTSCCTLLPGSCFSAEGSPHPVDMKATIWAALPS
jgi:hypothetical protein